MIEAFSRRGVKLDKVSYRVKMASPRKKVIRFSRLYSFSCFRSSFRDEHSQIGQKGYSRVVYCNDPDNAEQLSHRYESNYVSTTKYTVFNFIPKSLFEQFRRVANIYFLVVACVSYSPLAPYSAYSVLLPLLLVIGATMVKEAVEDWRRWKQVYTLIASFFLLLVYSLVGTLLCLFIIVAHFGGLLVLFCLECVRLCFVAQGLFSDCEM